MDLSNCIYICIKIYNMGKTMSNNRLCNIYTLEDPDTHEIRYVGKTVKPIIKRLWGHINDSKKRLTHNHNWVQKVVEQGKLPVIKLIEVTEWQYSQNAEIYWIAKFKEMGYNLNNHSTGGEGGLGVTRTKEAKEKASKSMIERYSKPTYQYTLTGEFIKYFPSPTDAAKIVGCRAQNVTQCCLLTKKSHFNFIWSYLPPKHFDFSKYIPIPNKDRIKSKEYLSRNNFVLLSKKIKIINMITNQENIVNSIQEASKLTNVSKVGICCECKGTRKVRGNFKFVYYEC